MYLFVGNCVILVLRPTPPSFMGREVKVMAPILTILESVVANVICLLYTSDAADEL